MYILVIAPVVRTGYENVLPGGSVVLTGLFVTVSGDFSTGGDVLKGRGGTFFLPGLRVLGLFFLTDDGIILLKEGAGFVFGRLNVY